MKKLTIYLTVILFSFSIISCNPKSKSSKQDDNKASTEQVNNQDQQTPSQDENNVSDQQGNSNEYVNQELGFAIWFPEQPQVSVDTVNDAGYKVPFHSFVYQGDDFIYMIAVGDYPSEALAEQDADTVLLNVMLGFANSQNMTVEKKEQHKVQGRPALIYRGYSGDTYLIIDNVIDGNKVYQIIMAQQGEYPDQVAENDFIGSFRFLND